MYTIRLGHVRLENVKEERLYLCLHVLLYIQQKWVELIRITLTDACLYPFSMFLPNRWNGKYLSDGFL